MQHALIVEDIDETGKWLVRVLLISFPDINITLCDSYRSVCDSLNQNQIFNLASLIHLVIALLIFIAGETIGLWYLYNKLVVPDGRMFAAQWLYQLTIVTAVLNILYVPYNAVIIAHEKMNAFAYISIIDVFLKLIIAILLAFSPFDKLIFYGS